MLTTNQIDMAKEAIKVFATWCGPCKIYGKTWSKVAEELGDSVKFREVDIDKDTTGFAVDYDIESVPTTVVIEDGEVIFKEEGRLSASELKEVLND